MIAFDAFSKRFGAQQAVCDLSLEIPRGSIVALLGPNGSGKTTTLKAAAGLIRPSSGAVTVGRRPASDPLARRACAYLPQHVSFREYLTGREVVLFHAALRGVPSARVREVLRLVALDQAASRAVGEYSGGMMQRLGLAVALLPDALVLLLDEPTAALDPEGLAVFDALVTEMKQDRRTVLFTTHQVGDVEHLVDRLAVLVDGRLAASMSRKELEQRLPQRGVLQLNQFYRQLTAECRS